MKTTPRIPVGSNNPKVAHLDPTQAAAQERAARAAAARIAVQARAAGTSPTKAAGRTKRKHPARRSRIAALALSLVGTGAMTVDMFHADHASAVTVSTAQGSLKKGSFTGAVSSNKWGDVQVRISVAGGKITGVTALKTPDHRPKSVRINDRAVPLLKAEVLTAQSASINNVSGATYTSDSYKVSLQSAIDQARGVATAA